MNPEQMHREQEEVNKNEKGQKELNESERNYIIKHIADLDRDIKELEEGTHIMYINEEAQRDLEANPERKKAMEKEKLEILRKRREHFEEVLRTGVI